VRIRVKVTDNLSVSVRGEYTGERSSSGFSCLSVTVVEFRASGDGLLDNNVDISVLDNGDVVFPLWILDNNGDMETGWTKNSDCKLVGLGWKMFVRPPPLWA